MYKLSRHAKNNSVLILFHQISVSLSSDTRLYKYEIRANCSYNGGLDVYPLQKYWHYFQPDSMSIMDP